MLLKRPDGCKLAQKLLDTVWSGQNKHFVRTDDAVLSSVRTG
jgi:hypothetical protein